MGLSLSRALRASKSTSIAFTGAGGKTSAMFQLARELSKDWPVIVSASSHLGDWQISQADRHFIIESSSAVEQLDQNLHGVVLVTGSLEGDRTKPLDEITLSRLNQFCMNQSILLLIEADGSRGKPLKAWAEHEPPIPAFVQQVVHIVGLTGIGKPLNSENIHRPEIFSCLSHLKEGEPVTSEALLTVLMHPEGGLKNIPSGARKTILLNQADTFELQSIAHGMVHKLLADFNSVVVASLMQHEIYAVHETVAGIILAAGESTRYGKPKQLLDWKGQSFVHAVAKIALEAGLSPVVVVTGANADQVAGAVKDLPVKVLRNNNWQSGQASSIRTGAQFIENETNAGAAIFLLVDQPQITASVLQALVEKHAEGLDPIVAPLVIDQRANPVLFDRETFQDLRQLEGDVGGRAIFHKYRVEYLPWHDDRLLLDVDTPEQYQRLISDDTL